LRPFYRLKKEGEARNGFGLLASPTVAISFIISNLYKCSVNDIRVTRIGSSDSGVQIGKSRFEHCRLFMIDISQYDVFGEEDARYYSSGDILGGDAIYKAYE
jgi:hypothetical protein